MMLSATIAFFACSAEMRAPQQDGIIAPDGLRSIVITGVVTDASSSQPLEDITIHFKAYPQGSPDASPLITDEVHTTSSGTFTIHASGEFHESLLCVLTAHDASDVYESKTNQVIVTWSGMSYDKDTGRFVVNDCSFQLQKAE